MAKKKPKLVRRVSHRCLRCRKSDFLNYRRTKCHNCGSGPEWIEKVVTYEKIPAEHIDR